MTIADDSPAREACVAYLHLRGALARLPHHHPDRPILAAAVASADRRWRELAAAPAPAAPPPIQAAERLPLPETPALLAIARLCKADGTT